MWQAICRGYIKPSIRRINGSSWEMWYAASRWDIGGSPTQNTTSIFRATSTDGVTWTKDDTNNPVLTPSIDGSTDDEEAVMAPQVIHDGFRLLDVFCR